jgi:S1-C subfamily serine protease
MTTRQSATAVIVFLLIVWTPILLRPQKVVHKTVYKTTIQASIAPQVAQVRGVVVHVQREGSWQGSGCLLTDDGILFTARHVTDGDPCGVYTVTLDDGNRYPVKYVLEDREADLSYMKLDLPRGVTLPFATLAPSDTLRVGDSVIIAGSPLGKDNFNTFSLGIISALNRNLDQREGEWQQYAGLKWHAMIQTTSPAYPGNSGGPIFDMQGHVVGVLVAGMDATLNYGVPVVYLRDSIEAVRQWFTLCRIRPLLPDVRGPQGPQGPPGQNAPVDPNHS